MNFTQSEKKEIAALRSRYPDARSLILPLMWMIQKREGWISEDAVQLIADELEVPPIWVQEVRSWYSMFNEAPKGKYILEVCCNMTCSHLGGEEIVAHICKKLKIKVGETTADGMFTLQTAECLGSCGTGPMMQVGENYYELLDTEKVDRILEDLANGKEQEQVSQQFPEYR
ncbi:NAD(P)H-dependent oxidoreductase subunit E [candidate division KSB1 bacterium]|nr:NAD(P)H-dependent oxidoreductase subunit E [candidate division KSB1 bacterium]